MDVSPLAGPPGPDSSGAFPSSSSGTGGSDSLPRAHTPEYIGKYQVVQILGQGSCATVCLVRHTVTSAQYACKLVAREMLQRAKSLETFERELRILASLTHPNIVKMYDVVYMPDSIGIITEYCSGGDMLQYVNGIGGLIESNAARLFLQLSSAIQYLHDRSICHRDIKLENILLDDQFNVKLCDFGVCREQSQNALLETLCGSPMYMAPELVMREDYDGHKADIWALGIVLYAMCAGSMPWDPQNQIELHEAIVNGDIFFPTTFTYALTGLLCGMLTKDPAQRYTIADVMKSDWLRANTRTLAPIKDKATRLTLGKSGSIALLSSSALITKPIVHAGGRRGSRCRSGFLLPTFAQKAENA